jgi:hypothetical protein
MGTQCVLDTSEDSVFSGDSNLEGSVVYEGQTVDRFFVPETQSEEEHSTTCENSDRLVISETESDDSSGTDCK